jgi:hypothetical protein
MIDMIDDMTKRITANLPAALLDEATAVSGKGITETLIAGLELVKRSRAFAKAQALRGKIHLDLDMDEIRERTPETRGRYQP